MHFNLRLVFKKKMEKYTLIDKVCLSKIVDFIYLLFLMFIVDLIVFEPSYNDRTSKVASGPIEDLILKANLHAWSTLAPDIKNPVDRCFSTSTQSAIKSHIALCWVCHHATHFVNV